MGMRDSDVSAHMDLKYQHVLVSLLEPLSWQYKFLSVWIAGVIQKTNFTEKKKKVNAVLTVVR